MNPKKELLWGLWVTGTGSPYRAAGQSSFVKRNIGVHVLSSLCLVCAFFRTHLIQGSEAGVIKHFLCNYKKVIPASHTKYLHDVEAGAHSFRLRGKIILKVCIGHRPSF